MMSKKDLSQQVINIADLPLPQLNAVKQQLQEEVNALATSFTQLKEVQKKYKECHESVQFIKPENEGKTIMVPLTSSLYVPGKLIHCDKVIVDVGTGYYITKSGEEAIDFYTRKVDFIQQNLAKLQATIMEKQNNLKVLMEIMQHKIQEAQKKTPATQSVSS